MRSVIASFIFRFSLLQLLIIFLYADPRCFSFPTFYERFQHLQYGFFFRFIKLKDILIKFLLQRFRHRFHCLYKFIHFSEFFKANDCQMEGGSAAG